MESTLLEVCCICILHGYICNYVLYIHFLGTYSHFCIFAFLFCVFHCSILILNQFNFKCIDFPTLKMHQYLAFVIEYFSKVPSFRTLRSKYHRLKKKVIPKWKRKSFEGTLFNNEPRPQFPIFLNSLISL